MISRKRVVFTTFGSLGDLHPFLAMAVEWQRRGHVAVIATSESYREKVESEGLVFASVRPELPEKDNGPEIVARIMDMKRGPEFLIRQVMVPAIRESYEDLLLACEGADAIIGHPLTFAVPLVAHVNKIPWGYVVIAPTVILSAYDPPHLAPAPWVSKLKRFGPRVYRLLFALVRLRLQAWFNEVGRFSSELGAFPVQSRPMGKDQFSPWLNLALFSSVLAAPQPDWPKNTVLTGFTFYDRSGPEPGLSAELDKFLESGPAPIAFTLGSAAVLDAGSFYTESVRAAVKLGMRAVLLVGRQAENRPNMHLPETVHVSEYAPYSQLFAKCAAVVHQGGVGTTAQVLRAGKPMLVMPYAFDQPDNGARVKRLGVGRIISRERYNGERAAVELSALLDDPAYSRRAETIGRLVRMENGAVFACDSIAARLF